MSAHPRRHRGRGEWITGLAMAGSWIFDFLTVVTWLLVIPFLLLGLAP